MDYNYLINQINRNGHSIETVANEIGMSRAGLYSSLKNETLKLRDFVSICKVLEVDPTEMAGKMTGNEVFKPDVQRPYMEDIVLDMSIRLKILESKLDELLRKP